MKYLVITVFNLGLCMYYPGSVQAQDTTRTLSDAQVKEIVLRFHPVARLADINIEKSKAEVTSSRAGFDPVFQTTAARKTFDGTNYYNQVQPELKIPTWYGIEISGGTELLTGSRIDPQETAGRTSFVGISVPLAKNLLMDKRRAALQTAKIFRQLSEVEKRSTVNDLLLDAMQAYWSWVKSYEILQVISQNVELNRNRVALVRSAFFNGDRPAIDTVEAYTQLQSFEFLRNEASLDFANAGLELSAYLWKQNDQPFTFTEGIVPPAGLLQKAGLEPLPVLDQLLDDVVKRHPDLLQYDFKLGALQVEKLLKFQSLLPSVNLKYNQLGKGYDFFKTATQPLLENNFKFGVSVGIPLRFSEGRGEYRKAKLKITETRISRTYKQQLMLNKAKMIFNDLANVQQQILLQQRMYENFRALQRAEETRFLGGESSLFLVNSRENKALESLQKLISLRADYLKTSLKLQWAAGRLQ